MKKAAAVKIPEELTEALAREAAAGRAFETLAPSHRREYAKWVAEGKRAETRRVRAGKVVQRVMDGV
jgi:uncharacterized protein YdeI (YjbR/CyaY-like superfamily)